MPGKHYFLTLVICCLIFSIRLFAGSPGKKIAIVGDLQKTSPWEFLMAREENDAERGKIIKSIANENASSVILLGDMVVDGSDRNQWTEFNNLIEPIRKEKIPIYPVLGNHEYWGDNNVAMQNVYRVFPVFKMSHWYSVVDNELAFIFLDSNSPDLTVNEWDQQRHWFEDKIKQYDADDNIKGIFVFLHHPPYTNSVVTGDDIPVQQAICPAFSSSRKGMILFSGHAHTYEKFYIKDKYFIISGGGGGPRVRVKSGLEFYHDLCTVPSPRPFHYIIMQKEEDGVKLTVKAIDKGGSYFYNLDSFKLYFRY